MLDLNKVTKILIYLLVFLLPLVLAGIANGLNFPKQGVLLVLACSALFLWLLDAILKGKLEIRFSILDFAIAGFLVIVALSFIFSRWPWASFWGWPQDTANSFLTVFCLALFYFLIKNLFEEKTEIFFLQLALMGSGFLVGLIGIFHVFGKFVLPWGFTKVSAFNTIGTFNSWGIFLAALIPGALALIFSTKGSVRTGLQILALPIFLGVVLSNYWVTWLAILFSMIVFLIFGLGRFGKIESKFLILIMLFFGLSLVFGVFKMPIPGLPATPLEVSPSLKATFNVSQQMLAGEIKGLKEIKDLLLGWGPGSFKYGWSRYKSAALNQTIFWNIRFSKGGSEVLEILGERGILGMLSFLAIVGLSLYYGFFGLLKSKKAPRSSPEQADQDLVFSLAPFASFLSLTVIKFLYPTNLCLAFLWWLFLALVVRGGMGKRGEARIFELKPDSRASLFASLALVLVLISGIVLFYFQGQRILAEAKYNAALIKLNQGQGQEAINLIVQAIGYNPQQEIFWQDLSQLYLARAGGEMTRTDISDEEKTRNVSNFVGLAVNTSNRASQINPANVANWQVRGLVYRSIIGWSSGAFEWANRIYERALELEPTNPFILLELARTQVAQASLVRGAERTAILETAEGYIKKALELKFDYAPAYYQQALIYEFSGKSDEAIATLEGVKQMAAFLPTYDPFQDVGLAFQLGILYYRAEDFDKAQAELERAIGLSPNYSNARYFLGLIYDKKGQKSKAIEQFELISQLNPDNEEVKKILDNLRQGKSALEGIVTTPEAAPIEEKPEEK